MPADRPLDPFDPSPSGETEYLGQGAAPPDAPSRRRRWPLLGAVAVGVAGVVAVGGWVALSVMSSGAQPAEAIPANAVGYVSVDLDPSASQKIEAIRMVEKFPALDEALNLSDTDDLRAWVFEKVKEDAGCTDLEYTVDVEPWIGDRMALAAMPAKGPEADPVPVVAVQVTDRAAATKGMEALAACGDDGVGVAFVGEYAVVGDSQRLADEVAAAAGDSALADDAGFRRWTESAGDAGIVTLYAAPGAVDLLVSMQRDLLASVDGGGAAGAMPLPAPELDRMTAQLRTAYEGFEGMAAVVRFADGAVEVEMASGADAGAWAGSDDVSDAVGLPSGTAVAASTTLADGWLEEYLDTVQEMAGAQVPLDQMWAMLEAETGLALPDDLETLLGDGFSLAVDADLDLDAAARAPERMPAGLRVTGDPEEITRVVEKIKAALGPDARMLTVSPGEGVVGIGLDGEYVDELARDGALGEDATFRDAVPEADDAAGVVYVDFDAVAAWVVQAGAESDPDGREVLENLRPLRALGMASWTDDDGTSHGRFRLTTD